MLKTIIGLAFVGALVTFAVIVCAIGNKERKNEEIDNENDI